MKLRTPEESKEILKNKLERSVAQHLKYSQLLEEFISLEARLADEQAKTSKVRDSFSSKLDTADREVTSTRSYILSKMSSRPTSVQGYVKTMMVSRQKYSAMPIALRKLRKRSDKKGFKYRQASYKVADLRKKIANLQVRIENLKQKQGMLYTKEGKK